MSDPNGKEAGAKFLAENASAEGVITLASGLQYKVLSRGGGLKHPTVDSPCDCHYAGRLLDGSEFDSSYSRGRPSTFAPNQVIKGWTEAMQLMVQGDKWEMYIPYELAYGAMGKPPKIPAAATLIFVMEIVKIKGSSVAKTTFPDWTADQLKLWLDKDEAACQEWRDVKTTKYDAKDEALLAKYPTREALDAWLDKQCAATKNKALWKRTATAAAGSKAVAAPPALDAPKARELLTKILDKFVESENKATLTALVAELNTSKAPGSGDEGADGMIKMMKILPVLQKMLAKTLEAYGFKPDDLMTVAMQLQSFAQVDPTIAVDCAKLMKAAQGDLSDFA